MSRATQSALMVAALLTAAATAAADKPKYDHVYGPEPSWAEFRRLGEAAIIARLIDPESARITWLSGIHKGGIKPVFSTYFDGYVACGSVNARNRMGGYTGARVFVVVIDYGRALLADIDHGSSRVYDETCARALNTGLFPPVPDADLSRLVANPATAAPAADAAPLANAAGLAVRAMPEGAYVAAVTPGSRAQLAGLKPGMVITSVNAIPLAGMGEAMRKVVDAASGAVTLTLIGGITIKLGGST
ncbi:PDZ domain-containing protein [Sphingomonas bacterium]|uniref:PDZ domain-containing protein n=1 Tax=Sphingomonas bacterium TaxID=1895847 RepID=UPI0015751F66|nr:PDZ domain-containing protein [Sphingomonas bacterium]